MAGMREFVPGDRIVTPVAEVPGIGTDGKVWQQSLAAFQPVLKNRDDCLLVHLGQIGFSGGKIDQFFSTSTQASVAPASRLYHSEKPFLLV